MTTKRVLIIVLLLTATAFGAAVAGVYAWGEYHLRQAQAATAQQDHRLAYQHLMQALRIGPQSISTLLRAAQAARRAGLLEEANQHLEACQRLQQGVTDPIRIERGLLRAQEGDWMEVEDFLRQQIEHDHPHKAVILEALLQGYMKTAQFERGRTVLRQLMELQPDNIYGLYWQGRMQEQLEDEYAAIADYQRLLKRVPWYADARKRLADLLIARNPREALGHLETLREQRSRDPALLMSLAACWKAVGDPRRAACVLDELLAERSEHVSGLIERGTLSVQNGDAANGEKWLRKAILLDPINEDAHYQLYQCLLQQPGRIEEARKQRDAWQRVRGDLARLNEIAFSERERALRDPVLSCEIGQLLLKGKQEEEAVKWLHNALEVQPDYRPAHRVLLEFYEKKGHHHLAEYHRKKLRANPGS
jgi:tetratricopeptide (TPR) repeat protein